MIKFKEHDGMVFRMLEEHEIVPLKENDANVLVRFITHGVIGEYVREHWLDCNQENVPIYIDDVDSDGDVTVWIDENRNEHHCCPFPMFEIIGTFVEAGSKDWALYKMVNGKKVCHYKSPSIVYLRALGSIWRKVRHNCIDCMSVSAWLDGADENGWEIYKESESQYKVGDWVEIRNRCDGNTYQRKIDHIGCEIHIGYNIYDFSGESKIETLKHLSIVRKLKPSEVIVKIGCLSGTVEKSSLFNKIGFILVTEAGNCWISFDALDKETRELVEGLLKAQEEEK